MGILRVPVSLTAASGVPVAVRYRTRDDTAKAGVNYYATHGWALFAPGVTRRAVIIETIAGASEGSLYLDLYDPVGGRVVTSSTLIDLATGDSSPSGPLPPGTDLSPSDLLPEVNNMLDSLWAFIQRATDSSVEADGIPPLITAEGMVLNNMMPDEGALENYTKPGAASSEGVALLMRGVACAAIATDDQAKRDYAKFLFNGLCNVFSRGDRPAADASENWFHSWLANGGAPFDVRGPVYPNVELSGYVYGRDPQSVVSFANGVGTISPAPDVVYQVVSQGSRFVWSNVFSDLVDGERLEVDYYIDAVGNKVFGSQRAGSYGQPSVPAGEHSDGAPGKIVLKTPLTGQAGVNFCVTVAGQTIEHAELYEGWPMLRAMGEGEFAMATDAIHWLFDAFVYGVAADASDAEWKRARDRIVQTWQLACSHDDNGTQIFKQESKGRYDSFPETHAYAYGRAAAGDPDTEWSATPPSGKYSVVRESDGFVTFTAPTATGAGGGEVRYGLAFENGALFCLYNADSKFRVHTYASKPMLAEASFTDAYQKKFISTFQLTADAAHVHELGVKSFFKFQDEPGDSYGDATGDWSGDDWEEPVYEARPFPGRRVALVGDSITYQNIMLNQGVDGRYQYYANGLSGWFCYAMQILNHPLELEPALQPSETPDPSEGGAGNAGYNFGIAGSKVVDWEKEEFYPLGVDYPKKKGPMAQYRKYQSKIDVVVMMGGTNDIAGSRSADEVFTALMHYAYEIAAAGKWVFWATIPPRTTGMLQGYTQVEQEALRDRIVTVNDKIRDFFETKQPANMYLVDWWDRLVGPNGRDPIGSVSNANGVDTVGNWKAGEPQIQFFPDGLHPGYAGSFVMGEVLAQAMTDAGVPARDGLNRGPLVRVLNLFSNSGFTVSRPQGGIAVSSVVAGRAIGLGPAKPDPANTDEETEQGLYSNVGMGYAHGDVPDYCFLYRSSNQDQESYSNFGEYTWSALQAYQEVVPYMAESSWADGCLSSSVITAGGKRTWRLQFSTPQTGRKNEAFVARVVIPRSQNGPWNNYGFESWPKRENPPNLDYSPGDCIGAEMSVRMSNVVGLHAMRLSANFLCTDDAAISNGDVATSGAIVSGLGNASIFWPPSLIDKNRIYPTSKELRVMTPIVRAPEAAPNERPWLQVNLEVSLDASSGPASVTLDLSDLMVNLYAEWPL